MKHRIKDYQHLCGSGKSKPFKIKERIFCVCNAQPLQLRDICQRRHLEKTMSSWQRS